MHTNKSSINPRPRVAARAASTAAAAPIPAATPASDLASALAIRSPYAQSSRPTRAAPASAASTVDRPLAASKAPARLVGRVPGSSKIAAAPSSATSPILAPLTSARSLTGRAPARVSAPVKRSAAAVIPAQLAHPRRNQIARLANVEVALVMHFLDTLAALFFSRCSKQLQRASDSKHSWQHALIWLPDRDPPPDDYPIFDELTPVPVLIDVPPALYQSRLIRLAPIGVRVGWSTLDDATGLCKILQRIPALHTINTHAIHGRLTDAHWKAILSVPCTQALHSVVLNIGGAGSILNNEILAALCALPHMQFLSVSGGGTKVRWEMLQQATKLTSLHLADCFHDPSVSVIPAISQLTSIKDLSIYQPCLYGDSFLQFCTSPCAVQLTRLKFEWFHIGVPSFESLTPIPRTHLAPAMENLRCLTELCCGEWYDVDLLLPHLTAIPSLRLLIVHPEVSAYSNRWDTTAPSVTALTQLLVAAPNLRCLLLIKPTEIYEKEWSSEMRILGMSVLVGKYERGATEMAPVASRVRIETPVGFVALEQYKPKPAPA